MAIFLLGLWMLLKWHHSRDSPWRHLSFRKLQRQRDKWTFAMGCGKVEDAWREIQSGWHVVCGLPGVIYACVLKHESSFSPRLTVISRWLNSPACLAAEYRLWRKGQNGYWTCEPPLLHREKSVNTSGQHNQARQRCVVITFPLRECRPAAFLWSSAVGTLDFVSNKQSLGSYFKTTFEKLVHVMLPFILHAKTVVSKSTTVLDLTVPTSVI